MAPLLTVAAATSIILSQRISSERQAATASVEDSRRTIVEGQTVLQQAGRLPTTEAERLREALQELWRSERDEFRAEARNFVTEAVAQGHNSFESALPDENAKARRSSRATGGKVLPHSPDGDHFMAGAPPKTAQSSPDVVVDVGGGINTDADDLSDRVRVQRAPSLTLYPASMAPTGAGSPVVGSPDPTAAADLNGTLNFHGVNAGLPVDTMVPHEPPIAWGSLEEEQDGSPGRKSEGGKKSSKKKSKHKDKEKQKREKSELTQGSPASAEGEEKEEGKSKTKDKDKKAKKSKKEVDEEPSPKKEKKSKGKKDEEEAGPRKEEKKSKDSKEKKEKSKKEKKTKE